MLNKKIASRYQTRRGHGVNQFHAKHFQSIDYRIFARRRGADRAKTGIPCCITFWSKYYIGAYFLYSENKKYFDMVEMIFNISRTPRINDLLSTYVTVPFTHRHRLSALFYKRKYRNTVPEHIMSTA